MAHLDQVHEVKTDYYQIHQDEDVIFAIGKDKRGRYCQVGTGSDDLTGVWLCLEMLLSQPILKVVFFLDEEVGCVGSSKSNTDFFKECAFVLQGDRRSASNDFTTYTNGVNVSSKEFKKAVNPVLKKHNYKQTSGIATDVGQLIINGIGCCAANMSCGYFKEHTDNEYSLASLSIGCLNLMEDIVSNMAHKRWPMPKQTRKPRVTLALPKTESTNSKISYFEISPKDPDKIPVYIVDNYFKGMRMPTKWECSSLSGYYYYVSVWSDWAREFFYDNYGKVKYTLGVPDPYLPKYVNLGSKTNEYKKSFEKFFTDLDSWGKENPIPKKDFDEVFNSRNWPSTEDYLEIDYKLNVKKTKEPDDENLCPQCLMHDQHHEMMNLGSGKLWCSNCYLEIDTKQVTKFH